MTDLTDAELDRIERMGAAGLMTVPDYAASLLAEVRARRAQDTPTDPAAPVLWALRFPDGSVRAGWWSNSRHEAERAQTRHGGTVVAFRAPGAVAAAPTEDEVENDASAVGRRLNGDVAITTEHAKRALARLAAAARAVPPAPSTGEDEATDLSTPPGGANNIANAGEDEAAVERAAEALHDYGFDAETPWNLWAETSDAPVDWRDGWRARARAALAAARGPRTQDDT